MHCCPVQDFRKKVSEETEKMINLANDIISGNKKKQYELYLKMLYTAWESELSIDVSEEALLRALRYELHLTYMEHIVLMHHPDLRSLWDHDGAYEKERNYLLGRGIILSTEIDYLIAEEIAPVIRSAWQIELIENQYRRLLNYVSIEELYNLLKLNRLPVAGNKQDKISTIFSSLITPGSLLGQIKITKLQKLCKNIGCAIYGTKEEVIDRILGYVSMDCDLEEKLPEEFEEEIIKEVKELNENSFKQLMLSLSFSELYQICSHLRNVKSSGKKDVKIKNLWNSPYSERTMLKLLRNQELSEICARLGLHRSGNKHDLIERLIDFARSDKKTGEEIINEQEPEVHVIDDSDVNTGNSLIDDLVEYSNISKMYPELADDEKIVLSFLVEMKSLNESEIDRMISSYGLNWFLPKAHMKELKDNLEKLDRKYHIEIKPFKYHDIYEVVV